jgi:AcrR family transcriptional regulator
MSKVNSSAIWHRQYTFVLTMAAGLRERKKLRTREQITEAAIALFAARGVEATTVDDIAAAADVSRRTFFRYFARKEDVILAWKQETAQELRDALAARPSAEGPLDAVQGALVTVAAVYGARRELTLGLVRLFERPLELPHSEHNAWDEVLATGLAERMGVDPARDPRPRLIATVGFAVLLATVQSWGAGGAHGDLPALIEQGFAALRREVSA